MADEIDRGQAEGSIPKKGAHAQGLGMSDLGLDSRRVSEWREVRDAGPFDLSQCHPKWRNDSVGRAGRVTAATPTPSPNAPLRLL